MPAGGVLPGVGELAAGRGVVDGGAGRGGRDPRCGGAWRVDHPDNAVRPAARAGNRQRPPAKRGTRRHDGIRRITAILAHQRNAAARDRGGSVHDQNVAIGLKHAIVVDIDTDHITRADVGDRAVRLLAQRDGRLVIHRVTSSGGAAAAIAWPGCMDPTPGDVQPVHQLHALPLRAGLDPIDCVRPAAAGPSPLIRAVALDIDALAAQPRRARQQSTSARARGYPGRRRCRGRRRD